MAQMLFVASTENSSTSAASLACNKPTGVVQNDLMLAHVVIENNADLMQTPPSGWTLVINATTGTRAIRHYVYRKVAGGSEPSSYTWALSAAREIIITIHAIRGADTSSPTGNTSTSTSTAASANIAAPTINVQHLQNWVFHFGCSAYGTTYTPPSGWTERSDVRVGTSSGNIAKETSTSGTLSVGATGTITAVAANSDYFIASLVEVKAAYVQSAGAIVTSEAFGAAKLVGKVIATGAIASLMAFGTAKVNGQILPWGNIESQQAVGTPSSVHGKITCIGIASLEAVGSHRLSYAKLCGGIPTEEAFGDATIAGVAYTNVSDVGAIVSAEGLGSPQLNGSLLSVGGLSSLEYVPEVTVRADKALCGGIPSQEAVGSPILEYVAATTVFSAGGIATAEAIGDLSVVAPAISSSGGIDSAEAFGSSTVRDARKLCGAILSGEEFGDATVQSTAPRIYDVGGIASEETLGSFKLRGPIQASGIASLEEFGYLWVYRIDFCGNIESEEAFGSATIVAKAASQIRTTGIATTEGVGSPWLVGHINSQVIATAEAFGTTKVVGIIKPAGIVESVGLGFSKFNGTIQAISGIATAEAHGVTRVHDSLPGVAIVGAGGIESEEAVGDASVKGIILASGIATDEAVGDLGVWRNRIRPDGIESEEAIGSLALAGQQFLLTGIESGEALGTFVVSDKVYDPKRVLELQSGITKEIELYSKLTKSIDLFSYRM